MVSSCGSASSTRTGYAAAPPEAVNNLCNDYGITLHRQAVNVSATTAGAVADSLRAALLSAKPWDARPRDEQVARCEYPAAGFPPRSSIASCPQHTFVDLRTLYFFMDARGDRLEIPEAVLGPPCARS
jgi:hypothetical protein